MALPTISYVDVLMKQLVEDWADEKGFAADEEICVHMEERFAVKYIQIVYAQDNGDHLLLRLTTELWPEPREFALLSNGSLAW